jgi:heat shock protein 4
LDILEVKELRNMLEAYSYEMRNNLDSYGSFEKYLDDATKATFLAEINQVVDWLYADGENAPKGEYRTRLEKFKAIGEPVRQRHFYYSELDVYFEQFNQLVQKIQEKKDTIIHLTDE